MVTRLPLAGHCGIRPPFRGTPGLGWPLAVAVSSQYLDRGRYRNRVVSDLQAWERGECQTFGLGAHRVVRLRT